MGKRQAGDNDKGGPSKKKHYGKVSCNQSGHWVMDFTPQTPPTLYPMHILPGFLGFI
jgi:hypothetical protein